MNVALNVWDVGDVFPLNPQHPNINFRQILSADLDKLYGDNDKIFKTLNNLRRKT